MSRIHVQWLGRFGNNMFQAAFALGFAARHGYDLTMDPWVGSQIFDLPSVTYCETPCELPGANEHDFDSTWRGADFTYRSYSQCQKCADYYSRQQLREWFKIKPEIEEKLWPCQHAIAAHVRRGDFAGYGYPLVSKKSYDDAIHHYGLVPEYAKITDELPTPNDTLPPGLEFLPDFYKLMTARTLLRANSSFSFWAAAISSGLVLSPEIAHLEGGKEHDVSFIPGNGARLSAHDFVTTIHIREV